MTHPITPPPELVQQWFREAQQNKDPDVLCWMQATAVKAAQWGADQELEACCEHIRNYQWGFTTHADSGCTVHNAVDLDLSRRPRPWPPNKPPLDAA